MSWDDEIPWSPEEQDAYRQNRRLWKRVWVGPSPESLWKLYGGHDNPRLVECMDCGRPTGKTDAAHFKGLCWNCHMADADPTYQPKAMAEMFPKKDMPQGKETNPLTSTAKRLK